jgi:putative transposase
VRAVLPERAKAKPVEIWFQDEARIGQKGTLTRIWARRGTRPTAPRDQRYAWAYLFGAVCPERAIATGLVLPCANAKAMNEHLKHISRAVAADAHALLVIDGAGYHEKADLNVPENITLLTQPAYSPELNPVENVWQYLRQNFLANRVYDDYDAIVDACCSAWNALVKVPDQLASITHRPWANCVIS